MIGRAGVRRAISVKPAFVNVEAYPVPVALGEATASNGYASTAGAPASRA